MFAAIAAMGILAAGCGSSSAANDQTLTIAGAGSSFVYPVLQEWIGAYAKISPKAEINYQPKGSGAGIAQFQAGTVDFGATDAPLDDEALNALWKPAVQFPIAAGLVVISWNVKGISSGLRLSGPVLANIFLGHINRWNDPAIAALNPTLTLPDEPIQVVHRADSSGTTFIFTSYLSSVSPEWAKLVGTDKSAAFPLGVGGSQNAGVAGQIKQNEGSIGYLELAYAVQNKMPTAQLLNRAGKFAAPTPDAAAAAIEALEPELAKDLRTPIVNAPGPKSYPICGFTYALVGTSPEPSAAVRIAELHRFLDYCITDGQALGVQLDYAPLPPALQKLDEAQLDRAGFHTAGIDKAGSDKAGSDKAGIDKVTGAKQAGETRGKEKVRR